MAQAKIYWDRRNYQQVEKIFHKSVEFCSEHDVWKLNVAHVVFMQVCLSVCDMYLHVAICQSVCFIQQETKVKEAVVIYEEIVKKHYDNVSVNPQLHLMLTSISPLSLMQLLSISAIVLANLCVSYVMTSQTEEV